MALQDKNVGDSISLSNVTCLDTRRQDTLSSRRKMFRGEKNLNGVGQFKSPGFVA